MLFRSENKERFIKNLNILLNKINFDYTMKKKRNIHFIDIEINNIMIYGTNVKLDIDKFNGIVGMCENNSSGKSTLCEIISLILFGETPRCYEWIENFVKKHKLAKEQLMVITTNFLAKDLYDRNNFEIINFSFTSNNSCVSFLFKRFK